MVGREQKRSYKSMETLVELILKKYALGETIPKHSDAIADDAIETFYNSAYHFYQNGKYRDALTLFKLLTLTDPLKKRFWMGLAASQQMEEEYDNSMTSYAFAALLDDSDPLPHLYAAECAMAQENKEEALKALQCAEERMADDAMAQHIALLKERWFCIPISY